MTMTREVYICMFSSRNKDNAQVVGFKERRKLFVFGSTDVSAKEKMKSEFNKFVENGVSGEVSRLYCSLNARDQSKVVDYLVIDLLKNKDTINIEKVKDYAIGQAMNSNCALTKKWLFDFDYPHEEQVLAFIEDIHRIDPTVEVEYFKTVNNYAVTVSHGFDTRELIKKWPDAENKRDGMLLIDWKKKD